MAEIPEAEATRHRWRGYVSLSTTTQYLFATATIFQRKYKFSGLCSIEEIQLYQPDGFHPVSIGDIYANGRYKILHKLGYGGSSTVWLARDLRPHPGDSDTLVALKVLSGYASAKPTDEIVVPDKLDVFASATHNPARQNFLAVKDYFTVEGPNGKHTFNLLVRGSFLWYTGGVGGSEAIWRERWQSKPLTR